jgi:hypothetical protein
MGLLDLLLQNQSALDTSPTPQQGNGPVGTPTGEFNTGTTSFQQVWNSNNTYLSAFEGGVNVGIQPPTLAETGLDIDNPNFVPSTTTPNTLTAYPATALGGLGQSAVQFLQIWTPVINYNNVVVGAPTSPLEQSLDETGLDVENQNAVPTTETPNTITQYPSLAKGEFGGSSGQFSQNYTPNNTYLNSNTINAQQGTLDLTGLDNVDSNSLPITFTPNNVSAPTDYGIISPSPQIQMGEFGGAPSQYQTTYTPNNTYLSQFNNIVNPTTNPQVNTLDETGLDVENPSAVPTTYAVPGVDNTTVYPANVTGEYNGPASPYGQTYFPNSTYEDIIVNAVDGPVSIIENSAPYTGLDVENQDAAPTTTTPNTITVYPLNVTGELGEAPSQFNQEWTPSKDYYNFMKENYQAH